MPTLQTRLEALLPDLYAQSAEPVQPTSMGSAGLKFAPDGSVAWDEMWGSFCDLAMAGGPPHRGTLLQPGTSAEIAASPGSYQQVTDEITRGLRLVTSLEAEPASIPGWLRIDCPGFGMSGWLVRAITMENVSARLDKGALLLPAGPAYHLEKEIKNVITVLAKTTHYWRDHTEPRRKQRIADLFAEQSRAFPLLQPALPGLGYDPRQHAALAAYIQRTARLPLAGPSYPGWLGLQCASVPQAIAGMRGLVACNILARREETALFLPVNPQADPGALHLLAALQDVRQHLWISAEVPDHGPDLSSIE